MTGPCATIAPGRSHVREQAALDPRTNESFMPGLPSGLRHEACEVNLVSSIRVESRRVPADSVRSILSRMAGSGIGRLMCGILCIFYLSLSGKLKK